VTDIQLSGTQWETAREHLRGHVEQVGFFLADYDIESNRFVVREWRPLPAEAFEIQTSYHVTLKDELRPELIRWAFEGGASLIEAHSHGDMGLARFSPSDILGFRDWVPHVRWRLGGRPYAAIVTAGESFDALAWREGGDPVQVDQIITDEASFEATRQTLLRLVVDQRQETR